MYETTNKGKGRARFNVNYCLSDFLGANNNKIDDTVFTIIEKGQDRA